LVQRKKIVVAAGRDMATDGKPFSCVGQILAMADQVLKLHALCDVCGADASFTVRTDNKKDSARCRRCRDS
jgi:thymidine kinase